MFYFKKHLSWHFLNLYYVHLTSLSTKNLLFVSYIDLSLYLLSVCSQSVVCMSWSITNNDRPYHSYLLPGSQRQPFVHEICFSSNVHHVSLTYTVSQGGNNMGQFFRSLRQYFRESLFLPYFLHNRLTFSIKLPLQGCDCNVTYLRAILLIQL